jgi:hypothetical protein
MVYRGIKTVIVICVSSQKKQAQVSTPIRINRDTANSYTNYKEQNKGISTIEAGIGAGEVYREQD